MGSDYASEFAAYMAVRLEPLRRSAYLLCRDVQHVEDLVQNAGMKLFVSWRHARVADDLDAYAHTVLVRVYLDERRRGWWRVSLQDWMSDRPARDVDIATRVTIEQALTRLTARQRAVVVLRFYADLSVEQTAAALNCSNGSVKTHTHRAMAALRQMLGDDEAAAPASLPRPHDAGVRT